MGKTPLSPAMSMVGRVSCAFRSFSLPVVASAVLASFALSGPVSAQASFENQWKDLIAAAQKEGEVVILFGGAPGRMYGTVLQHFSQKFGINVVAPPGSGNQLGNRVLAERQAGRFTADIIHMGGNTVTGRMLPAGVLDDLRPELIHPEVLDTSLWYKGQHWWLDPDQSRYLIFAARVQPSPVDARINTNIVNQQAQDSIQSAWDYFDPRWKGRIVTLPPTLEGGGQNWAYQYFHPDLGERWLSRLINEMDVNFVTDFRQISDGIATGRYAIAFNIGAAGRDIDALAEKGLPVAHFWKPLKEPGILTTSGVGMLGVATNRPNPNAARLFVNWWLSKEGQTARVTMADQATDQSLRLDVPYGNTNEAERRVEGVDYMFPLADQRIVAGMEGAREWAAQQYRARRQQ